MAHDLLPIKERDKVYYKTVLSPGEDNEQEKEMEIGEHDKIWVENRHRHMKDTIEKLMSDFRKFMQDNPHFANSGNATSLNAIKDMLAGLPQFQELKEAYSLHLSMAQECMNIFQGRKLADLASVEQSLATDLDEDQRKPKNLADQIVRLLDDESIIPSDRMRLIVLYLLYRDGLVPADTSKLLAHAQLPQQYYEIIQNVELLGARVQKPLKDKSPPSFTFGRTPPTRESRDEYALSRFRPALKTVLEQHNNGTLDPNIFPFTKPVDASDFPYGANMVSQASLRSAKPTWAKTRGGGAEPRQRVIVLMAGGATYAESRSCYEVSQSSSRDVYLATSHMLTPSLFIHQLADLSVDRRRLDLPADRPPAKAPQHLFEPEPESRPPQLQSFAPPPVPLKNHSGPTNPPTAAFGALRVDPNGSGGMGMNGRANHRTPPQPPPQQGSSQSLKTKMSEKEKEGKKKKHHFFSSKK
ncbi:MAG: vacuolar sorting protein VPS33/slp1 [Peltula sp. TS41687]|nr:MAG: vacuolar sorting protein VPS33/slp1 [Peltula sp. TS41687]